MGQYLALLRGINVGGKNIIKMVDLRACFDELGVGSVRTYIQSGNLIFESTERRAALVPLIERRLAERFRYPGRVVLRSRAQLKRVIARAPEGFGTRPKEYRYDVIFLKAPLAAKTAMRSVKTREGVDEAWAGTGVLYFSRLIAEASKSRLSKLASVPVYQRMTIRNWNTTTRLMAMMEET